MNGATTSPTAGTCTASLMSCLTAMKSAASPIITASFSPVPALHLGRFGERTGGPDRRVHVEEGPPVELVPHVLELDAQRGDIAGRGGLMN